MDCDALRDDQWDRISDQGLAPSPRKGKRGPRADNQLFLDALLRLARLGRRSRDLPERLGDYRPMMRRYYRRLDAGFLYDIVT